MSNSFIKKQVAFIAKNANLTDIYEIDRIRYGLEVFYSETSKIIIMILISIILDKLLAFTLMIILLSLIRPHIGGSHAKTYLGCLIQSNLSFITIYYLAYVLPHINILVQCLIISLSVIAINKLKPVNASRKKINSQYNRIHFKTIVTITLIIWLILSNIFLNTYYINCGLLIIIYLISDFLLEVYKNEKKDAC